MRFCASIGYAFRHRIGLIPDNILPQIPPCRLQGKSDSPERTPIVRYRILSPIHLITGTAMLLPKALYLNPSGLWDFPFQGIFV